MFVNLTPHDVTYIRDDGTRETFASQGVARAAVQTEVIGQIDGFTITKSVYGEPVNLPDPIDGTYLIVSLTTAMSAKQYGRALSDLLVVNEAVRDEAGRIIGCKSFGVVD